MAHKHEYEHVDNAPGPLINTKGYLCKCGKRKMKRVPTSWFYFVVGMMVGVVSLEVFVVIDCLIK